MPSPALIMGRRVVLSIHPSTLIIAMMNLGDNSFVALKSAVNTGPEMKTGYHD
jgi:hypothetical protein